MPFPMNSQRQKLISISDERVQRFDTEYQNTLAILNGTDGVYKNLSEARRAKFDSQVSILYVVRQRLFSQSYEFNRQDVQKLFGKSIDGGASYPYEISLRFGKSPVSKSALFSMFKGTIFFYYTFRGKKEPEDSWFDKTITKVAKVFGAATIGFITAGVGAAALGTAAPTAASSGLGALKGIADPRSIDVSGLATTKIAEAQAKLTQAALAAPKALADNAIQKAVASSPDKTPMAKVVNLTESKMAEATSDAVVSRAGFGSLIIGLFAVTALLSKRGN